MSRPSRQSYPDNKFRSKLHEIIFEADTPAGKAFDIALLVIIAASIIAVMLESVGYINDQYGHIFDVLEWCFTIFFTVEYILRLYSLKQPIKYATSFFGVVDLLATLPSYLGLLISGTSYLFIIRILRLLRVFRILKLGHFLKEGQHIVAALKASQAKITVFLMFVSILTVLIGSVMYIIEGGYNEDFSSIPRSVYWAIVTLTTVGYGDITPITTVGQFFSAVVMLMGYAIIAVPTGIVAGEIAKSSEMINNTRSCPSCGQEGHDDDAHYCKFCGDEL